MSITIDFDNTYPPVSVSQDLTSMTFLAAQRSGNDELIIVQLQPYSISRLPNVYNLAFGPSDGAGSLLDDIHLEHIDKDKVFSTIMLLALAYLSENKTHIVGLDGSTDGRARIYHMMFRSNQATLGGIFDTIGLDYYVKQLRDGKLEMEASGDYVYTPIPQPFDYDRSSRYLYRYYLFTLK